MIDKGISSDLDGRWRTTFIYDRGSSSNEDVTELVSAVGGGRLSTELDLRALAEDIEAEELQYDPEKYHGIILRFDTSGPAVLIYRSGSFSISGAQSIDELHQTFRALERQLNDLLGDFEYETELEIRNLVYQDKIVEEDGKSQPMNLNALAIGLGMKAIEYEPEQFPGLMYRPNDRNELYLVFGSGKIVSTGHSDPEMAKEGMDRVKREISEVLGLSPKYQK